MVAPNSNKGEQGQRSGFAEVRLSDLRIGTVLKTPIYDPRTDRDVLLLAAGTVVMPKQLAILRKRGLSRVRVNASEVAYVTGKRGRKKSDQQTKKAAQNLGQPFIQRIKKQTPNSDNIKSIGKTTENYQQSLSQSKELYQALATGGDVDGKGIAEAANEALMQMAEDIDLFVSMGVSLPHGDDVSLHGMQVSRLAMAIGAGMGLDQNALVELGIGCLVHDVGMMRVKSNLHTEQRSLSTVEFLEITKHPGYTLDLIDHIDEISSVSRIVAYQMHERWNGSGYPRRREGEKIHLLARIAAVADVFIALVSPRPHRPALLPHDAMRQVLTDTEKCLFDPSVVRHLLHILSLFPIGSFVEMNDGRVGKVVAANGEQFDRPVVELWQPWKLHDDSEVVDLLQRDECMLEIKRPIAGLTAIRDEENAALDCV